MSRIAIGFGIVLVVLGLGFYLGTGAPTAGIPAIFGLLLILCGWLATKPSIRMHAMHFAALLGLLGTIMPLWRAVPGVIRGTVGLKEGEQLAMAALCLVFLVLCIRSFIAARAARRAGEAPTS